MQTKAHLVEERREALHSEPHPVFGKDELPVPNELVSWEGRLAGPASMFVGPRVHSHMGIPEKGYLVVTPLYSPDNRRAILVRRGWVPDAWREGLEWQRSEPVSGVGVVTRGELGNAFVPDNEPALGRWFTLDPVAMARHCGLPEGTPLVEAVAVDEVAGAPQSALQIAADKYRGTVRPPVQAQYPQPKRRDEYLHFAVMPYDHLNYALTWSLVSLATAFLAWRLVRPRLRKGAPQKGTAVEDRIRG